MYGDVFSNQIVSLEINLRSVFNVFVNSVHFGLAY